MKKNIKDVLIEMQERHRCHTKNQFNRINPLIEDIVDWKQKGKFAFNDESITVYDSATIIGDVKVGSNTWVGPFTILDGSGGLNIGKYCSISAGVKIMTHDTVKWALSLGKENYEYGPIKIGDGCFIGSNAVIKRGLSIGCHCLIGAGAVVTKSLPDYTIALGTPAKVSGKVKIINEKVKLEYFEKHG